MAGTIHIETHDGKSFLRTAPNVHSLTHNGKDYLVVNGTHYNANTAPEVIKVLENARESGRTIWVDYGNQDTGRSWNEESDTRGRIRPLFHDGGAVQVRGIRDSPRRHRRCRGRSRYAE